MITIEEDKVTIPRKTWDKLAKDKYFEEMIELITDSEELADAVESDNDFMNIRDYIKQSTQ